MLATCMSYVCKHQYNHHTQTSTYISPHVHIYKREYNHNNTQTAEKTNRLNIANTDILAFTQFFIVFFFLFFLSTSAYTYLSSSMVQSVCLCVYVSKLHKCYCMSESIFCLQCSICMSENVYVHVWECVRVQTKRVTNCMILKSYTNTDSLIYTNIHTYIHTYIHV